MLCCTLEYHYVFTVQLLYFTLQLLLDFTLHHFYCIFLHSTLEYHYFIYSMTSVLYFIVTLVEYNYCILPYVLLLDFNLQYLYCTCLHSIITAFYFRVSLLYLQYNYYILL